MDFVNGKLMRLQPAFVEWDSTGCDHVPHVFAARLVAVVERSITVPWPLRGCLAASMCQLDCCGRASRLD
jgi:hypothetical protein